MKLRGWAAGVLFVTIALIGVTACGDRATDSSSGANAKSASVGAADVATAGQASSPLAATEPAERKQIRTGDVALAAPSADAVTGVADEAIAVTTDAGGQVDADRRTGGSSPRADLVLRVPPDALDETVERVSGLATVTSRSVQTEDVTSQYTDLEGRIAALETSTERLRGFLGAATDANQVALIEGELTKRESDLESLQGQLRVLSSKTDLASLKLSVRTEQSVETATAPAPAKALSNGWEAFRLTAAWGLAILLALAPFLVVLALVILAIRWWWRRRRRSRDTGGSPSSGLPAPPAPPDSPDRPRTPESVG